LLNTPKKAKDKSHKLIDKPYRSPPKIIENGRK
jgi:hypothetical protein